MECDHCPKIAVENGPICKACKWYLYLRNYTQINTNDLIRKGERELQNEKLNSAVVYMERRVKRLEDDIMCVVDRVAISKQDLLKRNCYNVTNGIKRLIAKTVSARCKKLNEEFAYTISQCLLDGKAIKKLKSQPSLPAFSNEGCSTSTLTEEPTTNAHVANKKNSRKMRTGRIKKRSKKRNAAASANGSGAPIEEIVATYHSQVITDENSIKIVIKKDNLPPTTQHVNEHDENETRNRQCFDADNLDSESSNMRNRMEIAAALPNENKIEEVQPGEQSIEAE